MAPDGSRPQKASQAGPLPDATDATTGWHVRPVPPDEDWALAREYEGSESVVPASRQIGRVATGAESSERDAGLPEAALVVPAGGSGLVDIEALRCQLETVVRQQASLLRAEFSSALASVALDLRGQFEQSIEGLRSEPGVSPADIEAVRRDVLAYVSAQVGPLRAGFLAEAQATANRMSVLDAELAAARSELEPTIEAQLSRRLADHDGDMARAAAAEARLAALSERVDAAQLAEPGVSPADLEIARRDLLALLRHELGLLRADLQAEFGASVDRRIDGMTLDAVRALLEDSNQRHGLLAEQVAADVARPGSTRRRAALRRSDAVEAPNDPVVQQVVAVLRSDLEAVLTKLASAQAAMEHKIARLAEAATISQEEMLERLDAMAGWVLAEATKVTGGRTPVAADQLAPLRSDVRMLEEQMAELNAAVAAMRRSTAPRRPPLLRNASAQKD